MSATASRAGVPHDQPGSQERASEECGRRVAKVMRRLGFKVTRHFELKIAPGVSREIDALCVSHEYEETCKHPSKLDGDDEDYTASPPVQRPGTHRRFVWVNVEGGRDGGVEESVISSLFGIFTYRLMSCKFSYLPSAIWVVTPGHFSVEARQLAEATNKLFGREFFVLVDSHSWGARTDGDDTKAPSTAGPRCPRCGDDVPRKLATMNPSVVLECVECGEVWDRERAQLSREVAK